MALATFNGEKYVTEQLESIVRQSVRPDEIVISDDRSTDATCSLSARVLKRAGIAFKIITNGYSRGFCNNFQSALEACSGDVIFLSDQDDFWHPKKVQIVMEAFDRQPNARLVMHDMQIGNAQLIPNDSTYLQELDALGIGRDSYCSGCAMALKKELLQRLLPFPMGLQDHDIWINEYAKLYAWRLVIDDALTVYRRHGANLTTNEIFTNGLFSRIGSQIEFERNGKFLKRQWLINKELLARGVGAAAREDDLAARFDALKNAVAYSEFRITAKSLPLHQRVRYILGHRRRFSPKLVHVAKDILLPFYK